MAELDFDFVEVKSQANPESFITVACACHDSRGTSWDKDGTITETTENRRCAKHAREGHPWLDGESRIPLIRKLINRFSYWIRSL